MSIKKWGILLVVLLFIALLAVGCGGENKETEPNDNQPGQEQPADGNEPADDPAEEPTEDPVSSGDAPLTDGVYEGIGVGYNGDIKIEVTVNGGSVTTIEVVEAYETEGIGGATLPELIDAAIKSQSTDLEAVSGATVTSEGFVAALENALSQAAQ